MYLLAIIGLLSSVVSAFYYLRIIKIMYFDEEIEKLQKKVAEKYGYKLVDHKLELYGVKVNPKDE